MMLGGSGGSSGVSRTVSIASSEGRWPVRLMLIGLSSSRASASRFSRPSDSIANGTAGSSVAGAVSAKGVTPKPGRRIERLSDGPTSFVSLSIRLMRTASANVTTAAQAATAADRAYKTPVLVGKRSRLAYPLAAAAIEQNEAQNEDQDRHQAVNAHIFVTISTGLRSTRDASKIGRFAFNERNHAHRKSPNQRGHTSRRAAPQVASRRSCPWNARSVHCVPRSRRAEQNAAKPARSPAEWP